MTLTRRRRYPRKNLKNKAFCLALRTPVRYHELMFATLRSTIVEHGSTFDAGAFTAAEAVEVLVDLDVIARVVDAMRSQAIKRIADTNGHVGTSARDAATFVARKLDVPVGQIRERLDLADQLEKL